MSRRIKPKRICAHFNEGNWAVRRKETVEDTQYFGISWPKVAQTLSVKQTIFYNMHHPTDKITHHIPRPL